MRITSENLRNQIEFRVKDFMEVYNLTQKDAQELLGKVLEGSVIDDPIYEHAVFINENGGPYKFQYKYC